MARKNKKTNIPPTLFAIVFVIVFSLLLFIDKKLFNKEPELNPQEEILIKEIVRQKSPYSDKENLNKLSLVENFKNSSKNQEPDNSIKVSFNKEGIITGGYLYIRSDVDGKSLDNYSSVYTKLVHSGNEYGDGGHLENNRSLDVPGNDSTYTELLYRLSDIPFRTRLGSSSVISQNWLQVINENENPLSSLSFSSTLGIGSIIELSIYYECLENTTCKLEK